MNKGVSTSTAAAALATNGFSEIEAIAALKTAGFNEEQVAAAISTTSFAASEGVATGATLSFSASLKAAALGLKEFLLTNPAGWAIMAAAAIFGVIKVVDALTETFEEAAEKAEKSKQAYEQTTSELESLNSELETNENRIKEIKAQGKIEITDQLEIDNLERENELLETQIKLKQTLAQSQQQEAAEDANNVLTKGREYGGVALDYSPFSWADEYGQTGKYQHDIIEETNILQSQLNETQERYNALLLEQTKLDPGDKRYKEIEKEKAQYENIVKSLRNTVSENISVISENYNSLFDSFGNVVPGFEDTVERVKNLINYVSSDSIDVFNNIVEEYSDVTDELKELGKQGKVTADSLKAEKYTDFINKLIELGIVADNTSDSLEKIANTFNQITPIESDGIIDQYHWMVDRYEDAMRKAEALHINTSKAVFGNIDLDNRKVLEWNDNNLSLYKNAIESWGQTVDDFRGTISTVFGGAENFDGVEIAFSPMLQTPNGAVFLDKHTVYEYIWGLIDKAGEDWSAKDLLKLDTEGLEFGGRVIKNLIADIGDTAIETSMKMHFLGTDGEIKLATRDLEEYAKVLQHAIYEGRAEGVDTSALEDEYQNVKTLITGYGELTGAYNEWKATTEKDAPKDNAIYKDVGASYDDMKKIVDAGWHGDESLNTYLDMLLAADRRTGDIAKDFDLLKEKIEGTNHSIMDYWQYDKKGNLVTDGLFDFLDDVNKKLGEGFAGIDENGEYFFDFTGDKLKEVANALGLDTKAVEMFITALKTAGMAIDLSDTGLVGAIEAIDSARESLKKFQDEGKLSENLNLEFNVETDELDSVKKTIEELEEERLNVNGEVDPELAQKLDSLIGKVKEQYYLRLNAETHGSLDEAAKLLNEIYDKTNGTYYIDTETRNGQQVKDLVQQIADLPEETQIAIGVDPSSVGNVESIIAQFNTDGNTPQIPVEFEPRKDDADEYIHYIQELTFDNKSFDVNIVDKTAPTRLKIDNWQPKNKYYYVTQYSRTVNIPTPQASGTLSSPVRARANGSAYNVVNYKSAYANGRVALSADEQALVNELGTESIIRDGRWFLLPGGMHQEALKKGDIILSAAQTKALLQTGKAAGYGRAYADGSLLSAYAGGLTNSVLKGISGISGSSGSRRTSSGSSSNKSKSSSSKSSSSGKSSSSKSSSSSSDDDKIEAFDWIEIAIDRIERAIDRLKNTATSTYKALKTRLGATVDEITKVNEELSIQERAYNRYLQQANSVGLSSSLAEKVKNGEIDINDYDEDTRKLIDSYKEWINKAYECSDAIQELHETLAELYEDKFKDIQDDYDNQLELLEHLTKTYETGIDALEAKGYLESLEYYTALRNVETQNVSIMRNELADLEKTFREAMKSGEIEEYSKSWYEMNQNINEVKESIAEANVQLLEYAKTMREIEWGYFDFIQDRIGELTSETDFLINLMSNSDLYQDNGAFNDVGMATLGLRTQNYNVYMAQADKYAKEMLAIDKELAVDPYNTDLIERREELLGLQQDSILAAEKEKQAIVDLVKDGIDVQLDSLKELISTYKDSLDNAKDLYNYQKKVNDKTKEIATIQKQLMAYSGDTSESTRARVQKLQVDLASAQEDLAESEYDKFVSDSKKLVDNLYTEYESLLNERLDDVDALLSDMIGIVNTNSADISNTLVEVGNDVGYTMSEGLRDVWNGGAAEGIVSYYGDNFTDKLTSINSVLNSIESKLSTMVGASDTEATGTVSGGKKETALEDASSSTRGVSKVVFSSSLGQTVASSATLDDATKRKVAAAIWRGGLGWGSGTARANRLAEVFGENNGIQALVNQGVGKNDKSSDITNYSYELMRKKFKGYKTGGLINYTGLAQVDGTPGKPEIVLNADDSANFIKLRDVLATMAKQNVPLFNNSFNIPATKMTGILDASKMLLNMSQTGNNGGFSIGEMNITIPIDHVEDYNDFVTQLQHDSQFERMIQAMTLGRATGKSALNKYKYNWSRQ